MQGKWRWNHSCLLTVDSRRSYLEIRTKKWQSRYFELGGHYLRYYEDKHNEHDLQHLQGAINLQKLRCCTADDNKIFLELVDDEEVKVEKYVLCNEKLCTDISVTFVRMR